MMTRAASLALMLALSATDAFAQTATPAAAITRNGRDIYAEFRAGLADPSCDDASSARWRDHFASTPMRLAARDNDVLPLFGYVVDALRAASLPTEYALIPFVESGYQTGARSVAGPAGLWQMIALTARDHHVPIRTGYDGRLSPIDSTQAAVRYLRTLHGMFAGDWRLAVMAYNAGEYRVFDALKRSGQRARDADPEKLVSLSGISQAYVRKLHALSCLLDRADDHDAWMQSLDRPVPVLQAQALPPGTTSLDAWSASQGRDGALVRRLNPAFVDGRVARADRSSEVHVFEVLVPMPAPIAALVVAATTVQTPQPRQTPRTHTVLRGDSASTIADRYQLRVTDLLSRNGLVARSVLHPGMVLRLDDGP